MHQSLFFKLFPPPKFLLMPHVGIDISDDAISFVEYSRPVGDRQIIKYNIVPLDPGVVEGGDIKDEAKLLTVLTDTVHQHGLLYAKISIPEEKAYLFETEIPYGDFGVISQNIEFKLEENIPLTAADAVFAFDLLPRERAKTWRASVSAVPRTYIQHMLDLFGKAGIIPVAFETVPRAIARVVSYVGNDDTIIIHAMSRKTGVYIVSGNAVGFTSTISTGYSEANVEVYSDALAAEIHRVYAYWQSKNQEEGSVIKRIIIVGNTAENIGIQLRGKVSDILPVETVEVWRSVLDTSRYVPPIMREDSYGYAPAAGLAL